MSFTGIASPTGADGTFVAVDTPDGSLLSLRALPESWVIPTAIGVWGVDPFGVAYLDPAGPPESDVAVVGYDVMGAGSGIPSLFLQNVTDKAVLFEMVRGRLPRPMVSVHAMPALEYPECVEPLVSAHAMPPLGHPEAKR